jgi:hypothetical protein
MSTYDIVYDIRYCIRYAHTMSYIADIRYCMYLQTYDIVYVEDSLYSTISYVIHTTLHVDIRYRKNIRYRTYDIVCPTMQYRIYDIVYTIWYTTSNTGHTISYVQTYDIVGDIRYRMWQESRCHHPCSRHKSPSYACPTLCWQNPAYPMSPRLSGRPSEACHVQPATATC